MSSFCNSDNEFNRVICDATGKVDSAGRGIADQWKNIGNIVGIVGDAIPDMIKGILTPEGIEILATQHYANKAISEALQKQFLENFLKNYLLEEKIGQYAAGSVIGTFMKDLSVTIVDAASTIVGGVLVVSQLLMLMDLWDPCDLNAQIDSVSLTLITDNYNKIFRELFLAGYQSATKPDGTKIFQTGYPIEYAGDNLLLQLTLNSQKCDYYNRLTSDLISGYILSLQVNSDGYVVDWTSPEAMAALTQKVPDINNPNWRKNFWNRYNSATGVLANNNTKVQNWIHRNWPLVALFFILILIIIFFIIKKRNVNKK